MANAKTKTYCQNCRHIDIDHKTYLDGPMYCRGCVVTTGISCDAFESGEVEVIKEAKPPVALVIHIVPLGQGEPYRGWRPPALCGAEKGRAGNPDLTCLTRDRWCVKCHKKFFKQKFEEAA